MEPKYVFSLKLCCFLCSNGFPIKKVIPNRKLPNKSVYVFENTDRLNDCIKLYNESNNTKEIQNDRFRKHQNQNCAEGRPSKVS